MNSDAPSHKSTLHVNHDQYNIPPEVDVEIYTQSVLKPAPRMTSRTMSRPPVGPSHDLQRRSAPAQPARFHAPATVRALQRGRYAPRAKSDTMTQLLNHARTRTRRM